MKRIAIFIDGHPAKFSTSVLCLVDELSKIYCIHIYNKNIDIQSIENNFNNTFFNSVFPPLASSRQKIILLRKAENLVNRLARFLVVKWAGSSLFAKQKHHYYRHIIVIDPPGLIFCKKLFPYSNPIYYSMELFTRHNRSEHNQPFTAEKEYIHDISALIIQSDERKQIFIRENDLTDTINTFILPIVYKKPAVKIKANYLRQKFGIESSVPIIIHIGGIEEYYSCIELAESMSQLKKYALIFHGYSFEKYKEDLKKYIVEKGIANVYITEEIFDNLEDISIILQSADIGIAWFKNISPNFETAGKSSGKISAYLQHGLPVVTNSYPSMKSAIEENNCGICIDDFYGLSKSLDYIMENRPFFAENAYKTYTDQYYFENYRAALREFIGAN